MLKRLLPHIAAVLTFALLTIIYFLPYYQGQTLSQGDVTQWEGMSHEITQWNKNHPDWVEEHPMGTPEHPVGSPAYHPAGNPEYHATGNPEYHTAGNPAYHPAGNPEYHSNGVNEYHPNGTPEHPMGAPVPPPHPYHQPPNG